VRHTLTVIGLGIALSAAPAYCVDPYQGWGGWWTCPDGYVIHRGKCFSDAEIAATPQVEVSKLPSAGDGARGSGGSYHYYYPSTSASSGVTVNNSTIVGVTTDSRNRAFTVCGPRIMGQLGC